MREEGKLERKGETLKQSQRRVRLHLQQEEKMRKQEKRVTRRMERKRMRWWRLF